MATKKIVPANPGTKATAKSDDKSASRKTDNLRVKYRKATRKTSLGKYGGH